MQSTATLLEMGYSKTIGQRLYSKVQENPDTGCLEWTGTLRSTYGAIHKKYIPGVGKSILGRAHRVAWEINNGPVPSDIQVCHTCDHRTCVNLEHLFLGTNKDNCDDRDSKGRQVKGEDHANHKLTELDVREIREMRKYGTSYKELASNYNVSPNTIREAAIGASWKHVN